MTIIKSRIDPNTYKYITLDNSLSVIIASNKTIDKAAASMTVHIGSSSDPPDVQGLAHFLEHMLFRGSDKYKQENYFQEFINNSGGFTNAFTSFDNTTYLFDILPEYFEQALEIWSRFFIDPLLLKDAIQREMHAVDSEFIISVSNHRRRIIGVLRELAMKNNPFHGFQTGNIETLNNPDIRDRLVEFHKKYYSANIMTLSIISNKDIKELEKLVIKLFSAVPNNNYILPIFKGFPYPENGPMIIKMTPIIEINELICLWQLPDMVHKYKYKSLEYIENLLGHEGDGGIVDILKKNDLCINFSAGTFFSINRSCDLFGITLTLTEKGFTTIPTIIQTIYAYIDLIISTPFKMFYNELKIINKITFDSFVIGNSANLVLKLSRGLVDYKPEHMLYGQFKYGKYNTRTEKLIKHCLGFMRPNNSIIMIVSKKYEKETNLTEKYYGCRYSYESHGTLEHSTPITLGLHLPIKNKFIPKNITIIKDGSSDGFPIKLKTDGLEIWYKQDKTFHMPQTNIALVIYSDQFYKTAENSLLCGIYFDLLSQQLNNLLYYASLCGAGFSYSTNRNSIGLYFHGYNDNIQKVIRYVMHKLFNMKATQDDFDKVIYNANQGFKNFKYTGAGTLAKHYLHEKFYLIDYTNNELSETITKISLNDVYKVKSWLLDNCYIKLYMHGNITKNYAIKFSSYFTQFHCINQIYLSKIYYQITQLLPGDQQVYIRKGMNDSDSNSVIIMYFEIENILTGKTKGWDNIIALINLIQNIVDEKFFTQLRSIEQFGYNVKASVSLYRSNEGVLVGLQFLIESSNTNMNVIRKRIKQFIKDILNYLIDIDEGTLDMHKTTIMDEQMQKFTSMAGEYGYYLNLIMDNIYVDYREQVKDAINKLTKQSTIEFYKKYFIDKNTRKMRIFELYSKKMSSL